MPISSCSSTPLAVGVFLGGDDRGIVDIHAQGVPGAQLEGGDGQDARAAAHVDHVDAGAGVILHHLQAQLGGGVGAGAKGHAGVDLDRHARPGLRVRSRPAGSAVSCRWGWGGSASSRPPSSLHLRWCGRSVRAGVGCVPGYHSASCRRWRRFFEVLIDRQIAVDAHRPKGRAFIFGVVISDAAFDHHAVGDDSDRAPPPWLRPARHPPSWILPTSVHQPPNTSFNISQKLFPAG